MKPGSIVQLLRHTSETTGLPLHFPTDLDHDERCIHQEGDKPFAWYLYTHGTHLIVADETATKLFGVGSGGTYSGRQLAHMVAENFAGGTWYWYEHGQLGSCDLAHVCRMLDRVEGREEAWS